MDPHVILVQRVFRVVTGGLAFRHVTLSAFLAASARSKRSATTATPFGSFTVAITPGIFLMSASFQLSGAVLCTGECSVVA